MLPGRRPAPSNRPVNMVVDLVDAGVVDHGRAHQWAYHLALTYPGTFVYKPTENELEINGLAQGQAEVFYELVRTNRVPPNTSLPVNDDVIDRWATDIETRGYVPPGQSQRRPQPIRPQPDVIAGERCAASPRVRDAVVARLVVRISTAPTSFNAAPTIEEKVKRLNRMRRGLPENPAVANALADALALANLDEIAAYVGGIAPGAWTPEMQRFIQEIDGVANQPVDMVVDLGGSDVRDPAQARFWALEFENAYPGYCVYDAPAGRLTITKLPPRKAQALADIVQSGADPATVTHLQRGVAWLRSWDPNPGGQNTTGRQIGAALVQRLIRGEPPSEAGIDIFATVLPALKGAAPPRLNAPGIVEGISEFAPLLWARHLFHSPIDNWDPRFPSWDRGLLSWMTDPGTRDATIRALAERAIAYTRAHPECTRFQRGDHLDWMVRDAMAEVKPPKDKHLDTDPIATYVRIVNQFTAIPDELIDPHHTGVGDKMRADIQEAAFKALRDLTKLGAPGDDLPPTTKPVLEAALRRLEPPHLAQARLQRTPTQPLGQQRARPQFFASTSPVRAQGPAFGDPRRRAVPPSMPQRVI